MNTRPSLIRPTWLPVVALALLVAACGGDDGVSGDDAGSPRSRTVDWVARTVSLDAPTGWNVAFCQGDGPFLCITRDGRSAGAVELLEFDAPARSLEDWAGADLRSIAADRRLGCGSGYGVEGDELARVPVAGGEGVRVAFTGYLADGTPAERSVKYALVRDSSLFLLVASAYEPDGCLSSEGGDFTVATLRAFEPLFADIAAASEVGA